MVKGLVSRLSLANHSDSESFLVVHALFSQDGCQKRILGGGWTCGVSFWPFLNPSGWWWLISSMVLTRTSCHKTTHANGYYGAWPGGAVSVSVLTLTYPCYLFLSYSFGTYIHTSQHSALWVTLICLYYIWISSTTLEGLGGYRSCCSFPPC